jgi:deoxyribodipyrimidine photo-lyase
MDINIVWLKNDLRINDNYCFEEKLPTIVMYIVNEKIEGYSWWWILRSLKKLKTSLEKYGIPMVIVEENQWQSLLDNLKSQYKINKILYNKSYESFWMPVQDALNQWANANTVPIAVHNNNYLLDPMEIVNQSGHHYKVFTPFWKTLSQQSIPKPIKFSPPAPMDLSPSNDECLKKYDDFYNQHQWLEKYWNPGEEEGHGQLKSFINGHLTQYKSLRDFPAQPVNSHLSPYLRTGSITARQIYWSVKNSDYDEKLTEPFLRQLGWRDFSINLLAHYPAMGHENLRKEFDDFPWVDDEESLNKWINGQTGYPIVDAAMNQLKQSGWIHNRVRMIVASFLTKDLRIHWTKGAQHFWQYLMDADEANNSASWQWVAGCGADAAPYYRIFNPVLQSLKFDSEGHYIRQWVPQLKKVSSKFIHDPWNHGIDYYPPMVDHKIAKEIALDGYRLMTTKSDFQEDGVRF